MIYTVIGHISCWLKTGVKGDCDKCREGSFHGLESSGGHLREEGEQEHLLSGGRNKQDNYQEEKFYLITRKGKKKKKKNKQKRSNLTCSSKVRTWIRKGAKG